jgi:mono/diheme cytochrome c family protein
MKLIRSGKLAIALAVVAFALAGCGDKSGGGGGTKEGRKLFKDKCGICHQLDDAGTTGTTGPDLDSAMPDAERVKSEIKSGNAVMPAKLYTGDKASTVADYVAKVAGKSDPAAG